MARRFGSTAAVSTVPAPLKQRFERKKTEETNRLRRKGWTLMDAVKAARAYAAFDILSGDFVKLEPKEDQEPYDPSPDEPPREREKLLRRVDNEGLWGIVSYWRPNPRASWNLINSTWGFVGDDWKDSGYDEDLMRAALRKVARGTQGIPAQIARMGLPQD